jgi:hypothetical protein
MMARFLRFLLSASLAAASWTPLAFCAPPAGGAVLMADDFNRPDGLVTNEYAFWNPGDASDVISPDWDMDSGSFFIQGGAGWTGVPDDIAPNAKSTNGNNSSVFRLNTKRSDFSDVAVSFSVLNQGLNASPSTPAVDWDGLHIWLHYQSEYYLYYASINRRNNTVVIKKKVPPGPDNGGTYYELTPYVPHTVPYDQWQNITATIQNDPSGSVTIKLYDGNTLLVSATDDGSIGGPPIRGAGKVGLRGDNANLKFDNFIVTLLSAPASSNPVPALTSVSPASANAGANGLTLILSGSNFISGSVVQWNGQSVTTHFVNAGQLTASLAASDLSAAGLYNVTVFNPAPGGGSSNSQSVVASSPMQVPVTLAPIDLATVRVFPNPWRSDKHFSAPITFDHLTPASMVTIFTVSGHEVKSLSTAGSSITWDLANNASDRVASGMYLYSVTNAVGQTIRGKLAIIR